ncbi:LOW QUALITY PROTEIN: Bloom syndrome protein homolog [Haliotis rubra]|uniref:LOW QUALITY PROTEIN: Bloom syndrome protein homolog n=1 Tax=Haliotis rubra TaxID=36100 RepID=UPI001EE5F0EC|nr:LOW QUALITY PROTEIN: Bloom syndrome protein homolog [Haliotis rubra]
MGNNLNYLHISFFVHLEGTAGKTYKMISRQIDVETLEEEDDNDQDEVDATENDIHAPTYVKMKKELQQGQFNIIYAHPETLLNNKTVGRLLRSPLFQEKVCAVVVDEVHMISEWGAKIQNSIQKLSEVICIFSNAAHLALTATANPQAIKELVADLQIVDFKTIRINPDRVNIFLEIQTRLPNIRKQEKLDNLIQPLAEDLCDRLAGFPLTVVYINNDEALGYCYQYVARHLKEKAYIPKESPIPENRIFAQYHKAYTDEMKTHIVSELRKYKPKIRLVLATVALGMGLNAPSIRRVIHFQPPTTLEKYFQEIGRAGRDGKKSSAQLFYNKNDIAKNREDMSEAMIKYCTNRTTCLRLQLVSYFGFDSVMFSDNPADCCINCRTTKTGM